MNNSDSDLTSDFFPREELSRDNADVVLIFLSSLGIQFVQQVDDAWYSAHRVYGFLTDTTAMKNYTVYAQDGPASVLGCTLQHQLCNPNLPLKERCEPLRGIWSDIQPETALDLWKSEEDRAAMAWARKILIEGIDCTIKDVLGTAQTAALVARNGLYKALQGPLPADQWQREVQHWFGASLASVQDAFVQAVTAPTPSDMEQFRVKPQDRSAQRFCRNQVSCPQCVGEQMAVLRSTQKLLSARYSSINVLGMSIILVVGALLVILDWSIESLADCIQKPGKKRRCCCIRVRPERYALLEWKTNAIEQLHRLAHEGAGYDSWTHLEDAIPIPCGGLGVVDGDATHPRLKPAPIENSKSKSTSGGATNIVFGEEHPDVPKKHTWGAQSPQHIEIASTAVPISEAIDNHGINDPAPPSASNTSTSSSVST